MDYSKDDCEKCYDEKDDVANTHCERIYPK